MGTSNSLTSPVLVSILPMVVRLFGILQVNQSCPSRSSQTTATPGVGRMRTENSTFGSGEPGGKSTAVPERVQQPASAAPVEEAAGDSAPPPS